MAQVGSCHAGQQAQTSRRRRAQRSVQQATGAAGCCRQQANSLLLLWVGRVLQKVKEGVDSVEGCEGLLFQARRPGGPLKARPLGGPAGRGAWAAFCCVQAGRPQPLPPPPPARAEPRKGALLSDTPLEVTSGSAMD